MDCCMNEDKKKALQALKTSKGQIDGIIKMIEGGRYCIDISNQIIAAQGLLKKANLMILRQHLDNCVKDAFLNDTGEEKVDEIMNLLGKLLK
ncbi:DNA-binding FrmR family transcriptional regulator [Clostridium algifaecis]|uniref:Copper-sensing transcriptional repressor CsoR n=2 Tax=Clostridium algifaecis TaxID=1472040 RepID=A0ABS4KMU2_9CLOT|nr:DNA-binding FrmR family transcriptional regulator [Clostridium algifaecis]